MVGYSMRCFYGSWENEYTARTEHSHAWFMTHMHKHTRAYLQVIQAFHVPDYLG